MGENLVSSLTIVFLALVGLGIIATLVSRNANTSGVINSAFGGLGAAITSAQGPVLGSTFGSVGYHE